MNCSSHFPYIRKDISVKLKTIDPYLSISPISNDLLNKIYSPDRLEKDIGTFEPYKAAGHGPDTLQPIIMQKAWNCLKDTIRNIMIKIHEKQHIPVHWRSSLGIFLPKPGKSDYNQPKSYRTITLSPVMLKLQEEVTLSRMWTTTSTFHIPPVNGKWQYGFKKVCSTEVALRPIQSYQHDRTQNHQKGIRTCKNRPESRQNPGPGQN